MRNYSGYKIVDADTHVIEPPDLWTSRVSVKKWGDKVPHVRWDEDAQEDSWFFGDEKVAGVAAFCYVDWTNYPPLHASRLEEVSPDNWDASARLARMDKLGIHSQVLYPNVAGFGTGRFLTVRDPELTLACVRAYNDFLVDFAAADPGRFLPMMAVPFWDMDAMLAEVKRAKEIGHRGIVFGSQPEYWGAPELTDRHWDPLWALAQDLELPINFHIASGDISGDPSAPENGIHANFAMQGVTFFMGNSRCIAKLICGGICHRFPRLNFVSVESGIGWLPYALSALDWQWKNSGVRQEHPEYDLLPSEYFKRQIYGCFWFEQETALQAIDLIGPDNFLYETDFPHPTSMVPGPATSASSPLEYIDSALGGLPEVSLQKILHGNAARLYGLDR